MRIVEILQGRFLTVVQATNFLILRSGPQDRVSKDGGGGAGRLG